MEVQDLLSAIRVSAQEIIGSESHVAVAYSGGLDSSIVARIAGEFSEVRCYTVGFPRSHDCTSVERLAEEEKVEVELILLDEDRLLSLMAGASRALGSRDPIAISYTVPILGVIENCRERLALVGSGADELFGGYAKYVSMEDPGDAMMADFEKAMTEIRALKVASSKRGRLLDAPFASERIRTIAAQMPTSSKVRGTERKIVLREVARELGLSSHARPKKAAQYSSGVMKEMRRLARSSHMDLRTWTEKIIQSS